jgi:protein TonB
MPHHRRSTSTQPLLRRFGPLTGILLMHVVFFYALNSGLVFQPAPAVPKEVVATFITPERPIETPKPQAQPAPPKTVPIVKKAAPPPPVPVVNNSPSEKAINTPPAPAHAPEPVAAAPATLPAPPAPPAAPAQPKTISSGVEYIQPPRPEYPPASRRMGEEGKAVLRVLVNDKGRAERIEVQKSSGSPRLDEAARQAAQRALFKPYMEDGKAVAVFVVVPISFQLD